LKIVAIPSLMLRRSMVVIYAGCKQKADDELICPSFHLHPQAFKKKPDGWSGFPARLGIHLPKIAVSITQLLAPECPCFPMA
jgi:hypothetical protein